MPVLYSLVVGEVLVTSDQVVNQSTLNRLNQDISLFEDVITTQYITPVIIEIPLPIW